MKIFLKLALLSIMGKTKFITLLLALLLSALVCEETCRAQEYFVENGIRYMLSTYKSTNQKYCVLVDNPAAPYSGVVEIPDSAGGYPVTEIAGAFADCKNLTEVRILAPLTELSNIDFFRCRKLEKVALPETLTYLGTRTFYGCHSLKEINFPEGIIVIPMEVFGCCTGFENMVIPENIQFIGMRAFEGCSFKSIKVPDRVEYIEAGAFRGSGLETIHIGKGLSLIGPGVFKYCDNLKDVYITAPEPPEFTSEHDFIYEEIDEGYLANVVLYVPEASMDKYRESEYWSHYKEIRSIESSGIADIEMNSEKRTPMYDLQGREVNPDTARPGIYIRDGRKIMVR